MARASPRSTPREIKPREKPPAPRRGKPSRAGGRTLSELEAFTLGLVWQLGPCSPYDIRRAMQLSPSSQWSGSAGAIYPLMRRLERMDLVESRAARTGKRDRRDYAVTPAGIEELRGWIGPPFPPGAISVTYDPLRSRARFLAALAPAQRKAWLKEAHGALDEVARMVEQWQREQGERDPILTLISRNGELETQARRQWLREMTDALG